MLTLEMAVDDAIHRIRNAYKISEGALYLSFSGGKDSTILAELIKMAELPVDIPFVFANTGVELGATIKFVNEYPYSGIVIVRPEKPLVQILREYGYPVINKQRSELLGTFQRGGGNPDATARSRQLIYGFREKNGIVSEERTSARLGNKDMHFAHPDLEYSVANKCCTHLKKRPFLKFAVDNSRFHALTGVRLEEGGLRSMRYKSCTVKAGKQTVTMPILDWTDELCDAFVEKYKVKLSGAYEKYGLTRTGCIACPFGRKVEEELKVLWENEPMRYKAAMSFFGRVYLDTGVKIPFDSEYMKKFEERQPIIEARRVEMLKKYRPSAQELRKC